MPMKIKGARVLRKSNREVGDNVHACYGYGDPVSPDILVYHLKDGCIYLHDRVVCEHVIYAEGKLRVCMADAEVRAKQYKSGGVFVHTL